MSRFLRSPRLALTALLVAVAAATAASAPAARFHTRLVKSAPAKDTTIAAAPKALELWFSERIDLKASRVRLTDATGKAVELASLTRDDAAENAPVVAGITGTMAAGQYTVNWAAASGDGHPVQGSFNFTVRP